VHILGYDFDLESPAIHKLCERHVIRRQKRNQKILENLSRLKMPIMQEELLQVPEHAIGRPHIAALMLQKGYVSSIKQAFQSYLGDGKSCFESGEQISAEETIETIHQGGGKAFIAHPHLMASKKKVKVLLNLAFDGLECYYGKFLLDQEKKWLDLAKEKNLLISGGSDFHGLNHYAILGSSWIDEVTFHKIFQRLL